MSIRSNSSFLLRALQAKQSVAKVDWVDRSDWTCSRFVYFVFWQPQKYEKTVTRTFSFVFGNFWCFLNYMHLHFICPSISGILIDACSFGWLVPSRLSYLLLIFSAAHNKGLLFSLILTGDKRDDWGRVSSFGVSNIMDGNISQT